MDWTAGLIAPAKAPKGVRGRVVRDPQMKVPDSRFHRKRVGLREIPNPWGLTPHRAQCVALLATGMTNAEIAKALGLSIKTVEAQLGDAFKQMQEESNTVVNRVWAAVMWDRFARGDLE